MSLLDIIRKRYATKAFDATRALAPADRQMVKELLRLSPSSVNAQPWHFIMAETPEGKARIAEATEGPFAYNKSKVLNAAAVVVFCARTDLPESYLERVTEQENADGRFATPEAKAEQHAKRGMYVTFHKNDAKDLPLWTTKQVYLNAGFFLSGVAQMGLDAVPIEGFDAATLDRVFGLQAQGLASAVIVAIGTRAENDFNAKLPKSRLSTQDVITEA